MTTHELDAELAERATRTLASLGLTVRSIVGDGSLGYPPDAPYAGIVVAAAAPAIPPPIVEQLAPGGRLVLPVGAPGFQELTLAWREDGELRTRTLGGCTFVPLVGRHGTHPGREG